MEGGKEGLGDKKAHVFKRERRRDSLAQVGANGNAEQWTEPGYIVTVLNTS